MQNRMFSLTLLTCLIIAVLSSVVFADTGSFTGESKIIFISNRTGNDDIFVINDNGTDLLQLTDSPLVDTDPVWSPDGSKILYYSYKSAFFPKYELWVVNIDGSNRIKLADDIHDTSKPQWSKDGSQILYVAKEDKNKIVMLINADGSEKLVLTTAEEKGITPSWSPDYAKILYSREKNGLYIMNPDGTDKVKITKTKGKYKEPTWSPDGTQIAYVYDSTSWINWFGKKDGVYVIDADGKNEKYLGKGNSISWCPDGETIAFINTKRSTTTSNDNRTNTTTHYTTYLASVKTKSRPYPLIKNSNKKTPVFWSPDGLKVAYIKNYVVYVRESGKTEVTKFYVPYAYATPRWSPDSTKIVCVGFPHLISKTSLYVFNFYDGKIYQLTDNTIDSEPQWSPTSK